MVGSYGVTAGGASPNLKIDCDYASGCYQGAGYVFLAPATGSVTIAWSFGSTFSDGLFAWVAYQGVDSIRGSSAVQDSSNNAKSTSFTAQSGDFVSVALEQYYASTTTATFTNATKIVDYNFGNSHLSLAEASPSGNVTITGEYVGSTSDGGILGVVLIPSAGSTGQYAYPTRDLSVGNWTPSSGTDLYAMLDEPTSASDTDYCYTNSNSTLRIRLGDLAVPQAGTQTLKHRIGGSAQKKVVGRLLDGDSGAVLQTFTNDPVPETLTTQSNTLSATIINYSNLWFEVEVADATTAPSPSVAYGAMGTGANGSSSVAPSYPTGITAGDLLVCVVSSGATNSETPSTPSGWTSQGSYATTDGTFGIDTGPRRITVFTKEATGSESGTLSVSITNGNTCRGSIFRFSRTHPSYSWSLAATGGDYSANGTAVSVTGGAIAFAPGDMMLVSTCQRVDTATQTNTNCTASGITFGTRTSRTITAVTTGNDHRHIVFTVDPITAGTGTVAPTWSYTASANCSAAIHFLRLREVPPTEFGRLTWVQLNVPAAVVSYAPPILPNPLIPLLSF